MRSQQALVDKTMGKVTRMVARNNDIMEMSSVAATDYEAFMATELE